MSTACVPNDEKRRQILAGGFFNTLWHGDSVKDASNIHVILDLDNGLSPVQHQSIFKPMLAYRCGSLLEMIEVFQLQKIFLKLSLASSSPPLVPPSPPPPPPPPPPPVCILIWFGEHGHHGSVIGLSPVRHQGWLIANRTLGIKHQWNSNTILSLKKIHLKMSSAKLRLFSYSECVKRQVWDV